MGLGISGLLFVSHTISGIDDVVLTIFRRIPDSLSTPIVGRVDARFSEQTDRFDRKLECHQRVLEKQTFKVDGTRHMLSS